MNQNEHEPAATRETRGTPDAEKLQNYELYEQALQDIVRGRGSCEQKYCANVAERALRVSQPVAPPPPLDEERFQRIAKFLSEDKPFCQVTPTNGTPWGFGIGEATRTFTLHICKNGCGFYVRNQGDECLSCSAKWLVEQINKLRAAPAGTQPAQEEK